MKIAIDVSGLRSKKLTGVGTYTVNLIKSLQNDFDSSVNGVFRISRFKHQEIIKKNSGLENIKPIIPFVIPQCDVFHGPDFWIPKFGKFKKVVTIHDLAVYHEDLYEPNAAKYYQNRYENTLLEHNPDHIIVDTEFIKNEFLNRFPRFENKISAISLGVNHFNFTFKSPPLFDFPYIVCLGTIEKRKNISNLYRAFQLLKQKNKEIKLILIGGMGFLDTELSQIVSEIKQDSRVILTGYLEENKAQNILSNALISVYPSLYEGFGFPILEPMVYGVPVITSNFGSMCEVASNAALVCDTTQIDVLAQNIEYLLENESVRNDFIQKGFERTKFLTWQKCAEQTKKVYQLVC
ncbi:MAG: glycosyltransferase family 1 protein [Bacteroidetes bacterium]|nr:MAG: glycosyltransferase family 1 protein [Bacteroidota bacterium]